MTHSPKMPFFSNLKKVLNLGGDAKKKKPNLEHIAVDVDPEEVGFLGFPVQQNYSLLCSPSSMSNRIQSLIHPNLKECSGKSSC